MNIESLETAIKNAFTNETTTESDMLPEGVTRIEYIGPTTRVGRFFKKKKVKVTMEGDPNKDRYVTAAKDREFELVDLTENPFGPAKEGEILYSIMKGREPILDVKQDSRMNRFHESTIYGVEGNNLSPSQNIDLATKLGYGLLSSYLSLNQGQG